MIARDDRDRMGSPLKAWTRALERTASIERNPATILPTLIDDIAAGRDSAPALIAEGQSLSYAELSRRAHRYSHWALEAGIAPGDVTALLMPNCPDYLAIWLGLTRIGAVVSLLNTHLVGPSLVHAVSTAAAKHLIATTAFAAELQSIRRSLPFGPECWIHGSDMEGATRIDLAVEQMSEKALDPGECAVPALRDRALVIYTSGTMGLPKAAHVSHRRLLQWSLWFAGMMNTGSDDRMYDCLPMYHSVGGVVAIGAMLVNGGSVVIRERFSSRRFWDDICDTRCTLFQYVGELCRYLVKSPVHPREREHELRLCCGNGLAADVWEQFQSRFAIPRILEFYAATEANFSLYNCEGKPGAIGRVPPFLAHRLQLQLVKVDSISGEPARGDDGLCIPCEADDPGEAICEIQSDASNPASRFEGYTDASATAKKILTNALTPGDAWYRSGDLMRRDKAGYYYFLDRLGATFRWKGENVSTLEVSTAISSYPGVLYTLVYGVAVPGAEGRAGMACIVTEPDFDLAGLRPFLADRLPEYARPLFVRLPARIETTGTFRPRVREYADAGFDPRAIADPLYVHDPEQNAFVPLDLETFQRIQAGAIRW